MQIASLIVTPDGPTGHGAWSQATPPRTDIIAGPDVVNTGAMAGPAEGQDWELPPIEALPRGTVSFWWRPPSPTLNGRASDGGSRQVLALPGQLNINVWWYTGYLQINCTLARGSGPGHNIQIPGLPGPQWVHLAWTWDADRGLLQGYVNGSPTVLPGTDIGRWQPAPAEGEELTAPAVLTLSDWAIAGLTIEDTCLDAVEACLRVPPPYRGALDHLIGARRLGPLDNPKPPTSAPTYENSLATADGLTGWVMEGPGATAHHDGWLEMWSTEPDTPGPSGHVVYWCPQVFPPDFRLEFEAQMVSELGLCITFFCARATDGRDIFAPGLAERTGIFGHYTNGDIDSYHCSWYANTPGAGQGRGTSNLRKNSGFFLVDQGPAGIAPGSREVHRVVITKVADVVEIGVDGQALLRWRDPGQQYGPVLGAGQVGFRQMKWMRARYRNLRVWDLG